MLSLIEYNKFCFTWGGDRGEAAQAAVQADTYRSVRVWVTCSGSGLDA
jgi:hypothetical protein